MSKRHDGNLKKVDLEKFHSPAEAVDVVKAFQPVKFDETVEIAIKLGVDPKQADQIVRGSFSLPKGIGGKSRRVVVFAEGDAATAAKEAGADEVGGDDLVKKVNDGWLEFDVAIASQRLMGKVGRLGRVLGPKGLMPSPKSGTVADDKDIPRIVKEFKAGKIEYRTDATGNVHAPIGKRSFAKEDLLANLEAFLQHIQTSRPASVKGRFMEKVTISTTMSPGVHIAVASGAV
ncbi:MAG: 50S ribosomal protein L1 [Planctomycetota bacterium]